jgi:hypothetical protein
MRAVVLGVVALIVATTVYATADCGGRGDSTPEGAFRAFSAALQATREDAEQMRKVYALLSSADRRELERRAKASERLGGEARDGAEMLVTGRVQVAWVPKKIEVAERGDRRVELAVTGPKKQRARVVMVREGGAWRVSLGLAGESP